MGNPRRRKSPVELGFPKEVVCMARGYLGHPQIDGAKNKVHQVET